MTMEAKRPLAERSPSAEGRGTLEGGDLLLVVSPGACV